MNKISISKTFNNKLIVIVIFITSLCMGIGYAAVNSVILGINATSTAKIQEEIFITDISCSQGSNNNLCNMNSIISANKNIMHSNISLSNNLNSTITYQVKLYNKTNEDYEFNKIIYHNDFYNNNDITYSLAFPNGTELPSKNYITINITFKYNSNVTTINKNSLESYLQFKFHHKVYKYPNIATTYSTNVSLTNISNYNEFTPNDIIVDMNNVTLPENNVGELNFTKKYTASTGEFTLSRNGIGGNGTIAYEADIYACKYFEKVATDVSGGYTINVDLSHIDNYQLKTVDDFYIDVTKIIVPGECTGTMYFSKTYNPSTGMLTINRTSVVGPGFLILFHADVYTAN